MSYIRVTQSVQDKGVLVRPEDLLSTITDRTKDWYRSPYEYGDEVLEYWKNNGNSIRDYEGEAWTEVLYWDFDCKEDFDTARSEASKLLSKLEELDMLEAAEIFFSGNKGIHIFLHTETKFNCQETNKICYNIAIEAGVSLKTPSGANLLDTSVYNRTRIFRIVNTKHQTSGLYKIKLTEREFLDCSEEEIRKLAQHPRKAVVSIPAPIDGTQLKERYGKIEAKVELATVVSINKNTYVDDFDPMTCPPNKRRCLYVLESGHFGPGERHNGLIRLAAYYKGQGIDRDSTLELLNQALEKRAVIYPDATTPNPKDTARIISEIYSDHWKGGTFTCKDYADAFLAGKCDCGHGPCGNEEKNRSLHVMDVNQLCQNYIIYGNEALKEYPKTGIQWLDERIRIRPKNYSVIAGAAGSGKTSLAIKLMEYLNEQNIPNMFFSLDMADSSIFEKLGARYTEYTAKEIEDAFNVHTKDPVVMKEVMDAIQAMLPRTYFDFTSALTSEELEHTISKINDKLPEGKKLQVAIIDYAGRMLGDSDNAYVNSTHNAVKANDIVKRHNIHLMYLSQISREKGDHTEPLFTSRVAKESGAWEENATFVLTCWRPFGDNRTDHDNYFHIYIGKNRSGRIGEGAFWWDGKRGEIRELNRDEMGVYRDLCAEHDKQDPPAMFNDEAFIENQAKLAKKDRRLGGTKQVKEEDIDDAKDERILDNRRFKRQGNSSKLS